MGMPVVRSCKGLNLCGGPPDGLTKMRVMLVCGLLAIHDDTMTTKTGHWIFNLQRFFLRSWLALPFALRLRCIRYPYCILHHSYVVGIPDGEEFGDLVVA